MTRVLWALLGAILAVYPSAALSALVTSWLFGLNTPSLAEEVANGDRTSLIQTALVGGLMGALAAFGVFLRIAYFCMGCGLLFAFLLVPQILEDWLVGEPNVELRWERFDQFAAPLLMAVLLGIWGVVLERHPIDPLGVVRERVRAVLRLMPSGSKARLALLLLALGVTVGAGFVDHQRCYQSLNAALVNEMHNLDDADHLRRLIHSGADVRTHGLRGETALMAAAEMGASDVLRDLLERGADVNAADQDGATALARAVRIGRLDIVRPLLAAGAEVNTQDVNGRSALHWATLGNHTELVKALLEARADVNGRDKNGRTALADAIDFKRHRIVRLLEQAGDTK